MTQSINDFLKLNVAQLHIREIAIGTQKLRVRVPLQFELDQLFARIDAPPQEIIDEISKELEKEATQEALPADANEQKVSAAAKTQQYILEAFGLLVNEDNASYPKELLTNSAIDADFAFTVQLQIAKLVFNAIGPNWEATQKN